MKTGLCRPTNISRKYENVINSSNEASITDAINF